MANSLDFFAGRAAVLATMHRKEQAIAPVLETRLGVSVIVPSGFNTDAFGTFTNDIKRPADQLTTARLKAEAALHCTGETLAVASEGSFGPHPQLPFIPCDRELVLLCDRQHQLEIIGEAVSTDTNYRSQTVQSIQAALAFAKAAGFPSHAVVVKDPATDTVVGKGITIAADLMAAVEQVLDQSPQREARLETDMRALCNPTRMQVIAQATEALVKAVAQVCPTCNYPGFTVAKRFPGRPCSQCGTPTLLTLSVLYECQHCQFQQSSPEAGAPPAADPSQCPYCNP